ncbi:MAG: toxin [Acidobacteria bacterium]|nr:toxin [Acidobacteriota bacterium]
MEFIEAPLFTRLLPHCLGDEDFRALQQFLARDPESGDIIPGTGGFRKLRWADPRRRKGKRGGLRMIYYYLVADSQIWFMTLYAKDEVADLNPDEKHALKAAIEKEARQRARRRGTRRK